jgi:hypothetical protein
MLEHNVEQYLTDRVAKMGGKAMKWSSAGNAGVMDRIVFLPKGRVLFVEVKRPGERLRPLQLFVMDLLRGLGASAHMVDCKAAVDDLLGRFA